MYIYILGDVFITFKMYLSWLEVSIAIQLEMQIFQIKIDKFRTHAIIRIKKDVKHTRNNSNIGIKNRIRQMKMILNCMNLLPFDSTVLNVLNVLLLAVSALFIQIHTTHEYVFWFSFYSLLLFLLTYREKKVQNCKMH